MVDALTAPADITLDVACRLPEQGKAPWRGFNVRHLLPHSCSPFQRFLKFSSPYSASCCPRRFLASGKRPSRISRPVQRVAICYQPFLHGFTVRPGAVSNKATVLIPFHEFTGHRARGRQKSVQRIRGYPAARIGSSRSVIAVLGTLRGVDTVETNPL